jgi:hypothetical protein
MLALADHANDDSVCWPGIERLAFKIRRTKRQAQSIIRHLEKAGEIYVICGGGRHNTNYYLVTVGLDEDEIQRVLIERLEVPKDEARNAIDHILDARKKGEENFTEKNKKGEGLRQKGEGLRQKGEVQRKKRVKPASPEPSLESSDDPPENHHGGAADAAPAFDPDNEAIPLHERMFQALASACRYELGLLTEKQRGQLNQTEKKLREIDATPAQVLAFGDWWPAHDWRGKKNRESPCPSQVREEWGRFKHWLQKSQKFKRAQAQARALYEAHQAEAKALDPDLKLALEKWESACEFMSGAMEKATYAQYIQPLVVLKPNGTFRLQAPSEAVHEWLEHRLRPTVERALVSAVGRKVEVEFVGPGEA